jgi:hypothetical protein
MSTVHTDNYFLPTSTTQKQQLAHRALLLGTLSWSLGVSRVVTVLNAVLSACVRVCVHVCECDYLCM